MTRLVLEGLPGDNPLGFMAALGTLLVVERIWPDARPRLAWETRASGWRPVLTFDADVERTGFLDSLCGELKKGLSREQSAAEGGALKKAKARVRELLKLLKDEKQAVETEAKERKLKKKSREYVDMLKQRLAPIQDSLLQAEQEVALATPQGGDPTTALGENLKLRPDQVAPAFEKGACDATVGFRRLADLLASFGCEAVVEYDGTFGLTKWSKQNGNSGKNMLADLRANLATVTPQKLERSLFVTWDYADEKWSLGWDPNDVKPFALQAKDPGEGSTTMHGANLLGFEALALFPACVGPRGVRTTGTVRRDGAWVLAWPLWTAPLSREVIRSLLAHPAVHDAAQQWAQLDGMGVGAVYSSEHFSFNKSSRLTPSHPV